MQAQHKKCKLFKRERCDRHRQTTSAQKKQQMQFTLLYVREVQRPALTCRTALLATCYSCNTRCAQFFLATPSTVTHFPCHLCTHSITLAAIYSPRNTHMRYREYMHGDSHFQQYFIVWLSIRPLRSCFLQNKSKQIILFSWVWQPVCESFPALGWAAVSIF